jgi:hypothetical protein
MNVFDRLLPSSAIFKGKPALIISILLYIILVIVYFPKYLWLRFSQRRIVAFDWHWDHYGNFYRPIYAQLKAHSKSSMPILFFFRFEVGGDKRFPVLRSGLPAFYRDLLDHKVVIAADFARYKKLPHTLRVQMFHGFATFSSAWEQAIELFDIFFLPNSFTLAELQHRFQNDSRATNGGKQAFLVGYPKLDDLMEASNQKVDKAETTLFYGPTYHREISSIFEFLPVLVDICRSNRYRLLVKLHPYLYEKHRADWSGGIDWSKRIEECQRGYDNIVLVDRNLTSEELGRCFAQTDLFLTDTSGLGYEFVLATGRPILFLGEKLKIPLDDLRAGRTQPYAHCPEIFYRGLIGPVVASPEGLELAVKTCLMSREYQQAIDRFREDFVPNLGHASEIAAFILLDLFNRLN